MEQNRKPEINPCSYGQLTYDKLTKQYWKDNLFNKWYCETGQLHLKSEIRSFFNTIHKKKLKMDERLKCETGHYKTFRGKYRQNILS